MEIIRRETDYALRCLLAMGRQSSGDLLSVRAIADDQGLPYELLRKVLQRLTKAGIVESIRGKMGGFHLALAPGEISMRMILEAVQGPVVVNRCVSDKRCCPNQNVCKLHSGIASLQCQITDLLEQSTLETFLKDEFN